MAETFKVKNISEAIDLAQKFKLSGKYNLFRGQAQNWKVQSSISRLSEKPLEEAKERLKLLYNFFESESSLLKYKNNLDWFFAVAQHYGIPTSFIDFTSNVEIAAFFATNSNSNKKGEDCVIICLNELDFVKFIKHTDFLYKNEKVIPPYLAKINVDNLWRLQAQEGYFLYSPFLEIENYYSFDKIVFPFDYSFDKISINDIYPLHKSELEIFLDQYFNAEIRFSGQKRFEKFSNDMKIPIVQLQKDETNRVVKTKQIHKSWKSKDFEYWQFPIKEDWINIEIEENINIHFSCKLSIENQIEIVKSILLDRFSSINRKTKINFEVSTKPKLDVKVTKVINRSCTRIWNGTRNLPYEIEDIVMIISQYICLEIYFKKFHVIYSISKENLIVLEMTNEYGSLTRCHASPSKIISSFRDDLNVILQDDYSLDISPKILLHLNIPNIIFDFNKLISLFKEELILYQVLQNSEIENPVIFYTPTQIKICGYA